MPRNIHPEGADKKQHHDNKAQVHHRVASRMKGVVKNLGIKKEQKEKKK